MTPIDIRVLGPLTVTKGDAGEVHLPAAVRQFVALIVAAGPGGLTKDQLAGELWLGDRPPSWKSAIRNRVTVARRHLGHDTITLISNRYRLAPEVRVDAWDLSSKSEGAAAFEANSRLDFLQREPFVDIAPSPLIDTCRQQIESARGALLRSLLRSSTNALSTPALETLRFYQRDHALDPVITEETVRAHFEAGDTLTAQSIIESTMAIAADADAPTRWITALWHLDPAAGTGPADPGSDASVQAAEFDVTPVRPGTVDRAALFASAMQTGQWTLAYEIATGDMAYSAPIAGDQELLDLLKQVPVEHLDNGRRFSLAVALAGLSRSLEPETARQQCAVAKQLASSSDELFLVQVSEALAGIVPDERALMTLPRAFTDPIVSPTDMRSFQVGVTNHLERASADDATRVYTRFCELVEASDDPFRRWHALVLEAVDSYRQGEWALASERAKNAREFGALFGIEENDFGWRAQVFNQRWLQMTTGRPVGDAPRLFGEDRHLIGEAFIAAEGGSSEQVEQYLGDFDIDSRRTFCVPLLVMLAPFVEDTYLKQRMLERLRRRTGTSAIFAAGFMHLGPVDRMCAHLSDDEDEERAHLQAAVGVADDQQVRLWQVVSRVELASRTNDLEMRDEAKKMATTSMLRDFVERSAC